MSHTNDRGLHRTRGDHLFIDPLAQFKGPNFDGALCAQADSELWFPPSGHDSITAKRICQGCPAKTPCLEWALTHYEAGIWGGTSAKDRAQLRRRKGEAA